MAKQSAFLCNLNAKQQAELSAARMFSVQLSKDVLLLSLAEEFGFGPERLKRASAAFDRKFMEYAEVVLADTKDNEYTKAKVDQALEQVCGPYFVPWEVRYG